MDFIAHVQKDSDGNWLEPHDLQEHLLCVAELASKFASKFDSKEWGYALGIAHDSGKGRNEWQKYIRAKSEYEFDEQAHLESIKGKLGHSTLSAKLAEEIFKKGYGRILSYCIAGHHTGLPDWIGSQASSASWASLVSRLQNEEAKTSEIIDSIKDKIRPVNDNLKIPRKFCSKGLDISLWIRMLFSALVDADFLDTEQYMTNDLSKERGNFDTLNVLSAKLSQYLEELIKNAPANEVNALRKSVLEDCRNASQCSPGFFSLTVPTGGGKTLSSLAFALEHAKVHGKERIIYVVPYTTIIEQNADVFKKALGADNVIEHHSNFDDSEKDSKNRLACENWDAPIIVTTTVQFFESLFAAKPSRCRKLHNICNSVVILDEAQLLPIEYRKPILQSLELLVAHYSMSLVICTATQPALGEWNVQEIVHNVQFLYKRLKRADISFPSNLKAQQPWEEIADELCKHEQVLCIVFDRKSCKLLHRLMPKGTYHLSALMCPEHRTNVIGKIKADLENKKLVRVISTQLVEAGVDIDFPVVYKSIAGLDSIAQAAGRCNREGKLNEQGKRGQVVVFVPPKEPPLGILRKARDTTMEMLQSNRNENEDPLEHGNFKNFFELLYWKANSHDSENIVQLLTPSDQSEIGIEFRTASDKFKIIDDSDQRSIFIPYAKGANLIGQLKAEGPTRWLLRKLQRYSIMIHSHQFDIMRERGSIEELWPGMFALKTVVEYDSETGLVLDNEMFRPEVYMI